MVDEISNMFNIYFIRQKDLRELGHFVNCKNVFVGDESCVSIFDNHIVYKSGFSITSNN